MWLRRLGLVVFAGGLVSPIAAQCRPIESAPCVLTLHGSDAPSASELCDEEVWEPHLAYQLPKRFADSDEDGWWETVLELDLNPARGCSCVVMRVYFGAETRGHLVHVGDSATNDGYGGDAGTDPQHCAEAQLVGAEAVTQLSVFSASNPGGTNDLLMRLNLPEIANRFVEFEVCDQFVAFALGGDREAVGSARMRTLGGQSLFAIGGGSVAEAGEGTIDPWIYAGFNRVIHRRGGDPAKGRVGAGVRRVELFLTP